MYATADVHLSVSPHYKLLLRYFPINQFDKCIADGLIFMARPFSTLEIKTSELVTKRQ